MPDPVKLTFGPFEEHSSYEGDPHTYAHADLILDGKAIGSVHQNGYKPRWAFEINQFRWSDPARLYLWHSPFGDIVPLLFDGAAFDSVEEARTKVETQLTRFFEKHAEEQAKKRHAEVQA